VLRVGLTGGIAVGKTAVVATFAGLGAVCFDADTTARAVVAPGTPGLAAVVEEFGPGALAADGSLDRAAVAGVVFADAARRARLEAILHPLIIAEQDRLVAEAVARDPRAIAVVDAALMIESGSYTRFDTIVVVHCDPETQIERLMNRGGFTREQALARVAAQMPQAEKLRYADYAVDTSGTIEDTRRRAEAVWAELVALERERSLA
jgi:dephospho-CoA kinase